MCTTYLLNFKKALFDSAKANIYERLCKCFVKSSLESHENINQLTKSFIIKSQYISKFQSFYDCFI